VSEQRGDPAAQAIAHDADAHVDTEPNADAQHAGDGHGAEPLGPIDTTAWAAGLVGVLLGLAVAISFVFATAGIG
jgi:hypothetical protein